MYDRGFPLWVNLVGSFGYSIVITFYFIRFEKKIESAMLNLTSIIKDLKRRTGVILMRVTTKMSIICKARAVINYYGIIIEQEELTNEEKDILCDFIVSATRLSNKMRDTFNESNI